MSCETGCYQATVNQCDDIIIRAGFPPNYSLIWTVQKPGKRLHTRIAATENNGDLTINKDHLPPGYLFAGDNIKIGVRLGTNYLQPVLFTFDGEQHECIMAKLIDIDTGDDDVPANVIQGTTPTIVDGPGSPYLIPITSADFVDANGDPSPNTIIRPGLDGKLLAIFWNDVPRFLTAIEWHHITGGIQIDVAGFDAEANEYQLYIYIIGNEII